MCCTGFRVRADLGLVLNQGFWAEREKALVVTDQGTLRDFGKVRIIVQVPLGEPP